MHEEEDNSRLGRTQGELRALRWAENYSEMNVFALALPQRFLLSFIYAAGISVAVKEFSVAFVFLPVLSTAANILFIRAVFVFI